jgi:hypothetical protein
MEVHIPEDARYGKALRILHEMGGTFLSKPTRILVIGPVQHEALVRAGVLEPSQAKGIDRGQKKKQA